MKPLVYGSFLNILVPMFLNGRTEENLELEYFGEIKVFGPFRVYLEKGDEHAINIKATAEEKDNMITEVKNGRLKIRTKTDIFNGQEFRPRIVVTYTELRELTAKADADLISHQPIEGN